MAKPDEHRLALLKVVALVALLFAGWIVVPHVLEALVNGRGVWVGNDGEHCIYWRWGEQYRVGAYRCPWFLHPDESEA